MIQCKNPDPSRFRLGILSRIKHVDMNGRLGRKQTYCVSDVPTDVESRMSFVLCTSCTVQLNSICI